MLIEIYLYAELLAFLAGTLLYAHLAGELLRRPQVLPGNWPLRATLICLTVWHGGTLIDHQMYLLLGSRVSSLLGTALDLTRAFAWLLTYSFLAHTLARTLLDDGGSRPSPGLRWLPILGYLSIAPTIPPAIAFAEARQPLLAVAVREIYPRVILHTSLTLGLAIVLAGVAAARLYQRRLAVFLRGLQVALAGLLVLLVASSTYDIWSRESDAGERLLRLLVMAGWLVPGALFAFYVQRYNLLRLTLSFRTLRLFLAVLLLALVVTVAGPVLGVEDVALVRRFVAWGLLIALFLGTAYAPLMDKALRRSRLLRSLMGRTVTPQELDRLMDRIQSLEMPENDALSHTAAEVGRWLGSDAAFLPSATDEPETAPFWDFFGDAAAQVVHRLDPPDRRLARLLVRRRLNAVFALRVDGRLEGLLALPESRSGGGYADGELEAVRLVIRQLAATLALRRLVTTRVAEERRLAEQERLGLLGLVSASLAHEIKNPLSSMKALAQALREDLAASDPDGDGVADLDVIVEQIDRLHQTAREILGIARPQGGDCTDLEALVRSATYVLQAEARKRGVGLDHSGVGPVGEVCGSAASWQTVIFNLVLNAVEHAAAGDDVRVSLARHGDRVVFAASNPGEALDEQQVKRIFEPFVSQGGTGLGLALVARRLAELGGEVRVDHQAGRVVFEVEVEATGEGAGA